MKLSKLLLLVAFLGISNVFAEDKDSEDEEIDLNDDEISFDEDSMSGSKICDKAIEKMSEYHEEIDKDPKCSYNEEYAKEHDLSGVYTTDIENRQYYCTKCINKFNAAGLAMYKICGDHTPEDYLYRTQFMYFVEQLLCLRAAETMAKQHAKELIFCQTELERLTKEEGNKPLDQWSEKNICSECVAKTHFIVKKHEHFYNAIKNTDQKTPFHDMLRFFEIEKDCFKPWEPEVYKKRRDEALKKLKEEMEKKKKEDKKNEKSKKSNGKNKKKEEKKEDL
ncbi:hypothetical protein H8356DRAFT_297674 [Neocallimastix lanati (nom. inval.)]|jgi:hypothetical protein|uniref:Uncharacterized protein n=1 Tax=Neocallimastix californiae TaxID=1754190 RepID=A0A1Y2FIA3_9FUNG|nr:hypothetical protein H8356DRAFT_297674 [Neocallimastix sp. JGI-2020a]ORY83337.1 hypothetical protein LY90DRAFT_499529 [Neocallimastix californiae]|eukprot:ORY83337.1 hypothetical protein LY90DRAFT_499529 [Neocallimastix californiae]